MESGDLSHLGLENVVAILMIHSVSPKARRLVEKIYTGDPYRIDIKLDSESSNRKAEILNAYMKAIGYKFNFVKKRKKKISPYMMKPFYLLDKPEKRMYHMIPEWEHLDDSIIDAQISAYKKPHMYMTKPYLIEDEQKGDNVENVKDDNI